MCIDNSSDIRSTFVSLRRAAHAPATSESHRIRQLLARVAMFQHWDLGFCVLAPGAEPNAVAHDGQLAATVAELEDDKDLYRGYN